MPIAINGSGTVTGISVGGLPDGIVDADMLAANAVTAGKLASGVGGKNLQVLQTVKTDVYNADVNQGAYGVDVPGLTVSITPSNASNKILVSIAVSVSFQDSTPNRMAATLFKDGSVISGAIGDTSGNINRVTFSQEVSTNYTTSTISGEYLDTAGSTNAITYSVRLSHGYNGTKSVFVNRASSSIESNSNYHHRSISTITVKEVAA